MAGVSGEDEAVATGGMILMGVTLPGVTAVTGNLKVVVLGLPVKKTHKKTMKNHPKLFIWWFSGS